MGANSAEISGLWEKHNKVATGQALSGLVKNPSIGRLASFAAGSHLHPGNTVFGRQAQALERQQATEARPKRTGPTKEEQRRQSAEERFSRHHEAREASAEAEHKRRMERENLAHANRLDRDQKRKSGG
jgi:hypothetical protein